MYKCYKCNGLNFDEYTQKCRSCNSMMSFVPTEKEKILERIAAAIEDNTSAVKNIEMYLRNLEEQRKYVTTG